MHHASRPQNIRHHMGHHQGQIHQHPPPQPQTGVGMNMGPQSVGCPPHHHMSANVTQGPPHGSNHPIGQYIPPHQRNDINRYNHHNQPRMQQPQQLHQSSQAKLRSNVNHLNGSLSSSSMQGQQQSNQHPQIQQQSQQPHLKQYHQGVGMPPHTPGGMSKHPGTLKPSAQPFPHKLSQSPPKKILTHLTHPLPSIASTQSKSVQFQQTNPTSITNNSHSSNISNSNPINSVPKHITILTKPPPTVLQIPITQPPPAITQSTSNVASIQQSQSSQQMHLTPEELKLHQNIQSNNSTQQQQHLIEKQPPLKSGTGQLQSAHNVSNQTTISSTTNSVLVSITHQQTQQTVVVQQQQQQAQAQQIARQGQSLDNPVSILQNSSSKTNLLETNGVTLSKEASSEINSSDAVTSTLNDSLANNKEKTPMCLVNELARYNRIQHQYRLTSESGPAHAKRFTVTLKLGDEEYSAEGLSIKKAQHLAAADAISKTKYQHPPPKSHRLKNKLKAGVGTITPTVELNALAMKLGEPTIYILDNQTFPADGILLNNSRVAGATQHSALPPPGIAGSSPPATQPPQYGSHQSNVAQNYFTPNQYSNYNRPNAPNGMYNAQRFPVFYPKRPFAKGPMKFVPNDRMVPYNTKEPCRVTLVVGPRKFVGVGASLQAARHDAATRALEVIKPLVEEQTADVSIDTSSEDVNSDLKSPISLVHEIALKRNLSVVFEVTSERGPPHMKTFKTKCKVGDIETEGDGNGKKLSKKRAALNMLEELRKLPPVSPSRLVQTPAKIKAVQKQRKPAQPVKRKSRNIIKEQSRDGEVDEEVNPISKLIQIQQALKEREPVYTVVEERGAPRRREFVIEVSANGRSAKGIGSNKKVAKRLAAENLLSLLGSNNTTLNTTKDVSNLFNNNTTNTNNNIDNVADKTIQQRVKFLENVDVKSSSYVPNSNQGRQIVPGILLMQKQQTVSNTPNQQAAHQSTSIPSNTKPSLNVIKHDTGSTAAATSSGFSSGGARPKDQLLYLGQLLGFEVQYSDYPKGNHGAYLSIVTLSTDPPQLCHGSGNKIEESQDEASLNALRQLSELGLDNVKPKKMNCDELKT